MSTSVGSTVFYPEECATLRVAGHTWPQGRVAYEANLQLNGSLADYLASLSAAEREGVLATAARQRRLPSTVLRERFQESLKTKAGFRAPKGAGKYKKLADVPLHVLRERVDAGLCYLCGGPGHVRRKLGRRLCAWHASGGGGAS